MAHLGKALRDAGISRALDSVKAEYREHYRTVMARWYATVPIGGRFKIEDGHALLGRAPPVPQQMSGLSNAFITPLLDNGQVELFDQQCSDRPANHATRTRVYRRIA